MGEPAARFYAERQQDLIHAAEEIVTAAYRRYCLVTGRTFPGHGDLQLTASAGEVAREDSQSLATAARGVVEALAQMKATGWIDDLTAASVAFKFTGEPLGQQEIERIVGKARPDQTEE